MSCVTREINYISNVLTKNILYVLYMLKRSSILILHQTYTHSRKRDKGWYENMDGWMGARTDGRSGRCQKHFT